jgi:transposase
VSESEPVSATSNSGQHATTPTGLATGEADEIEEPLQLSQGSIQEEEIERPARKRTTITPAQRAQVVQLATQFKIKDVAVASELKLDTVRAILRGYRQGRWSGRLIPEEGGGTVAEGGSELARTKPKRGRPALLTQDHVVVAARYLVLFPRRHLQDAIRFLKDQFAELANKTISTNTLSRQVRGAFGLRKADFKRVPARRNLTEHIEARFRYCSEGLEILEELETALYIDEAGFTLISGHRGGWSVTGYRPIIPTEGPDNGANVVTLLAAVCPRFGLVHQMTVTGSVNGPVFRAFLEELVVAAAEKGLLRSGLPRRLVWDNASMHTCQLVQDWLGLNTSVVRPHKLPPCSPFLNPIEECFGIWKYHFANEDRLGPARARTCGVRELIKEASHHVTPDIVSAAFRHTRRFWAKCIARQPITTHEIIDGQHEGDEFALETDRAKQIVEMYLHRVDLHIEPVVGEGGHATAGGRQAAHDRGAGNEGQEEQQ